MPKGQQERKPRGRPALPPGRGKRYSVGIRTTKEIKDALQKAADSSGRSLAQEIEYRLQRSFRDDEWIDGALDAAYEPRNVGVLFAIGRLIGDASRFAEVTGQPDWLDDYGAFDDVLTAVNALLRGLRPAYPADVADPRMGRLAVILLRMLGDDDAARRPSWATKTRARLGPAVSRRLAQQHTTAPGKEEQLQ